MDATLFLGYLVGGLVAVGGLIAMAMKVVQPMNDLRIVIQKLVDKFEAMEKTNDRHDKALEKHERHLDKLDDRVGKLETTVDIYHKEGRS